MGSPFLEPFVLRKIDGDEAENQKAIGDKMEELEQKWALPSWLVYYRAAGLGFGIMLLAISVLAISTMGKGAFSNVYSNLVFSFGIVLTFLGIALLVIEAVLRKKVEGSEEYKLALKEVEALVEESRSTLGVPPTATAIDVFFFPYTLRGGEMKDSGVFKYVNHQMRLFEEGNLLCLSDEKAVFGIEKKLFRRMLTDPKKVGFTLWNKKDSHLKEPYKSHRVTLDHYGVYHVKNTCSVQFTTHDEEKFEIVIPPYEMEHFEKILNLKIREKDEDE